MGKKQRVEFSRNVLFLVLLIVIAVSLASGYAIAQNTATQSHPAEEIMIGGKSLSDIISVDSEGRVSIIADNVKAVDVSTVNVSAREGVYVIADEKNHVAYLDKDGKIYADNEIRARNNLVSGGVITNGITSNGAISSYGNVYVHGSNLHVGGAVYASSLHAGQRPIYSCVGQLMSYWSRPECVGTGLYVQ